MSICSTRSQPSRRDGSRPFVPDASRIRPGASRARRRARLRRSRAAATSRRRSFHRRCSPIDTDHVPDLRAEGAGRCACRRATSRASGQAAQMTKGENGVWETTVGPVEPGAYRYTFNVDGVTTIDPASPSPASRTRGRWSLVYVPGADILDTRNVPHGAVGAVTYYSTALKAFRRMHVYTPPGYEIEHAPSTRCSTCCTAPATATTRGPRSAAPASSSTT